MEKPTFIDLFAGCGGLSLGLMKAGWQGLFAIEKSQDAFATLSYNLCDMDNYQFDWPSWLPKKSMTTQTFLKNHKEQLSKLKGTVDLIAGGPPCQGFSSIGLRNPDDPRNKLTNEYIKIVEILQPKFLLLENVKGFNAAFKGKTKPYSLVVKEKLEALEYKVDFKMIEASSFGVPQPRTRFIMLATRKGVALSDSFFSLLEKAVPEFRETRGLNGHKTSVFEAISDLEKKNKKLVPCPETKGFQQIEYIEPSTLSGYQKLMRHNLPKDFAPNSLRLPNHKPETVSKFKKIMDLSPKGKTVPKDVRDKLQMKKQCLTPLHADHLARTVTTLPDDMLHYDEPRILTVRENARLQSFPDWFEFKGKFTTGGHRRKKECPRYTQVGNAVPPLMAEAIGTVLYGLTNGSEI